MVEVLEGPSGSRFHGRPTWCSKESSSSPGTPTSARRRAISVSFTLVSGDAEPLPGIRCLATPGHVPFHQSVLIESSGERVCFLADLVPTAAHLPLPWIMGYDLEPLVTLESKRRLYQRAEAEGWLLFFEHDAAVIAGRLGREGKGFGLVEPLVAG